MQKGAKNEKICIFAILLCIGILLLTGCMKTSPEKILDMYSSYAEVFPDDNRVGISIRGGTLFGDRAVAINFDSYLINQNEDNCMALASRCHLFDAENPEIEIATSLRKVEKTEKNYATGVSTHSFGGWLTFSEDVKCDYMLLKFDGVDSSEAPGLETPALFFIISVDKKEGVTVLTQYPLLDE